jgi:glucose-6-phosphate isomerase
MIKLQLNNILMDIDFHHHQKTIELIHNQLKNKTGLGSEFTGWLDLPNKIDHKLIDDIIDTSQYIRNNYEVLVVCGIGGSYLGARAAIEAINGLYPKRQVEIIYLGQTFSSSYTSQVLHYLQSKLFAINVISKSGSTLETSIAFDLLLSLLESKIGKTKAKQSIFVTTDSSKGRLKDQADYHEYKTFIIPSDIGGRYSVLTPVGLLPMATAGIDIKGVIQGAVQAYQDSNEVNVSNNGCYQYALARYLLSKSKSVELFVGYEPQLTMFIEWLKQLFGESEGKQKRGLWPASAIFSTDLHSLGQFIQEGTPLLFQTILIANNPNDDVVVSYHDRHSQLDYLSGQKLSSINHKAYLGTLDAHVNEGKVPCIVISVDKFDAYHIGYLFYFFMKACAVSAYLLEVNPFDQPGVEVYKKNMLNLLKKNDDK